MATPRNRYGVRRFCGPFAKGSNGRPDCFEVYDRTTGECASFGCYRYEAREAARAKNAAERARRAVCPNCHQWARPSRSATAITWDCVNECVKRGFATFPTVTL
jgi:hypothetical protein